MKKAFSVREYLRVKKKTLNFEGEWAEAFGQPESTGVWFIWGASGSGKSNFVMQLCKELCKYGRVALNSLEEGVSLSIQQTIERNQMECVKNRLIILNKERMEDLSVRMSKPRSPQFYIIDSFQYAQMSAKDYYNFVDAHPNKLIVFVSHVDGKQPDGRPAKKALFDADLKIWVEGYRAISRGRFIGPKGYYTIWQEGADTYWGVADQDDTDVTVTDETE